MNPSAKSRELAQLLLTTLQNLGANEGGLSEKQLQRMITEDYKNFEAIWEKGVSFGAIKRVKRKYQLGDVVVSAYQTKRRRRPRRLRSRRRSMSRSRRRTRRAGSRPRRAGSRSRRTERKPARRRTKSAAQSEGGAAAATQNLEKLEVGTC